MRFWRWAYERAGEALLFVAGGIACGTAAEEQGTVANALAGAACLAAAIALKMWRERS